MISATLDLPAVFECWSDIHDGRIPQTPKHNKMSPKKALVILIKTLSPLSPLVLEANSAKIATLIYLRIRSIPQMKTPQALPN